MMRDIPRGEVPGQPRFEVGERVRVGSYSGLWTVVAFYPSKYGDVGGTTPAGVRCAHDDGKREQTFDFNQVRRPKRV